MASGRTSTSISIDSLAIANHFHDLADWTDGIIQLGLCMHTARALTIIGEDLAVRIPAIIIITFHFLSPPFFKDVWCHLIRILWYSVTTSVILTHVVSILHNHFSKDELYDAQSPPQSRVSLRDRLAESAIRHICYRNQSSSGIKFITQRCMG